MKYRLITFDFDGTLADSADWFINTFNQLAAEFRFKPLLPEEHHIVRGFDTPQILQHLAVPMWKLPRIVTRMRALSSRDRELIQLFPGIDQLLSALHRANFELAIVSTNSPETIRNTLGPINASLIHHYACGASIFGKASKLKGLLQKTRRRSDEMIYIGDETRDGVAAREAGIAFGAVAWGYASLAALQRHSPALVFEQVGDILSRLND